MLGTSGMVTSAMSGSPGVETHTTLSAARCRARVHLSFAKTRPDAQVVDPSVLIRPQCRLDDRSPAAPPSAPPLPVRRPAPTRPREPGLAPAARRLQASGNPAATTHN